MKAIVLTIAVMAIAGGSTFAAASDATSKADADLAAKVRELLSTEPIACYRALAELDKEMIVGLAVRLCSGTTDATKTVACYAVAWLPASDGGLGLNRGNAIDLCRSNSL